MHFEAFISSQKQDVQQHLEFIQKLYIALDEPDGVAGVAASRKQQPTLHEQILDQKSSGKMTLEYKSLYVRRGNVINR